jgi:hypothetical protein
MAGHAQQQTASVYMVESEKKLMEIVVAQMPCQSFALKTYYLQS